MESGKLDLAVARFKSALARYPNKLQLIYDYPQALAKAGRTREAAAFLETVDFDLVRVERLADVFGNTFVRVVAREELGQIAVV